MDWRPIPGFEGYVVSDRGQVRALARRVRCGTGSRVTKARILTQREKPGAGRGGLPYLYVQLFNGIMGPKGRGVPTNAYVHRIICLAFHGPPSAPNMQAHHEDHDRHNNSASNLSWVTPSENVRAAVTHRRSIMDLSPQELNALLSDVPF